MMQVVMNAGMASLAQAGPGYAGRVVLSMPASKTEVRITNSNYQKLAQ